MTNTVLILDDSLTVRMDLANAFDAAGFESVPCATAELARAELARRSVDIIILDVLLPDADGIDLLRELRATPAGALTPILMLSSEAEVRDRIRGLATGADDYIGKPYNTGYVIARAHELLRTRRHDERQTTVIVIEDSPTYRNVLRTALQAEGYRVITAATGNEGLRAAAAERPDGIVVDGVLPDIDGATVIRSVRLDAALRGTACVLLTASEDASAELTALDAGADAFVRKTEDVGLALAKLAVLLRRQTQSVTTIDDGTSLLGPKKILAVDDSPTFLHEVARQLRGEGFEVVLARSGEEALDAVAVEAFDCVLLDVLMPGLGGQETCRRMKAVPVVRDIPLVMLTALEDRAAMIDALGAGADDYIPKSSEFGVLLARVRAQLRRKQFEDENRRIRDELLRKEIEATEARAAVELAETRASLVGALERKNQELEAFSYSVSHDLRAPLRSIDGFSQALLEDYERKLDPRGQDYLRRVRAAAQRMGELIDDLLQLSRIGRADLRCEPVDLSTIARDIVTDLAQRDPDRQVDVTIEAGVTADVDRRLLRAALDNLISNAWKFTALVESAAISFTSIAADDEIVISVGDNGAGFDMRYAEHLFHPFKRLHSDTEFPGTGIGLATVHRIIDRHGGRVWAEAAVGRGATFSFTIPSASRAETKGVP